VSQLWLIEYFLVVVDNLVVLVGEFVEVEEVGVAVRKEVSLAVKVVVVVYKVA